MPSAKHKSDNEESFIERGSDKGPNPVDIHVGTRLRMRRSLLGISQEKLAETVGLTFQQIQKYERGTNRVSASRLYQFSKILEIPVSYFFEKFIESNSAQPIGYTVLADNEQDILLDEEMLHSKETLDLLRLYYSFGDEKIRREFLKTIKSMADVMKGGR